MANPTAPSCCATDLESTLRPELFKALCDPRRLSLLGRLAVAREPLTVTEAADCCGVHLSGVSRHLGILKDAGVVTAEREGREVRYQVDFAWVVGALRGLADALEACCGPEGACSHDSKGASS